VGSLVILAMNGMGAVGSVVTRRMPPDRAMVSGALTFAVGVTGTVVALLTGSLALFFVAAVVSGFGFGSAFLGAVATATRGVAPGARGGLLSAVFVVGYLAFSVPAIVAGVVAGSVGLAPTAEVYGAALVVLALGAVAALRVTRRRAAGAVAEKPAEASALAA
jgi:MFS family permease